MALPAEGGGTTTATGDWWIFRLPPPGGVAQKDSGSAWVYVAVQDDGRAAAQKDAQGRGGVIVAGPFIDKNHASSYISKHNLPVPFSGTTAPNILGDINPVAWLTQKTGGVLAAAVESGFVAITRDIWAVISGPLLVIAGLVVAAVVLIIFFKDDLTELAAVAAKVVK